MQVFFLYIHPLELSKIMRTKIFSSLFVLAIGALVLLTGCPNPDNKIPPNCFDGILNNGEQMVDCGGPCEECDHCLDGIFQPDLGETCLDCGGECGACDQCSNCLQDGDETGIDCGGTYCGSCADLCADGLLNGTETQVDCGGPFVDLNANMMYDPGEPYMGFCDQCPTCTDNIMNGDEIGVDCGGTMCGPCTTDGNCTNNLIDGDEFWTDCGGSTCPSCDTILSWTAGGVNYECSINWQFLSSGGNVSVIGQTIDGLQFAVTLQQPVAGWLSGLSITLNPSAAPNSVIAYTNAAGTVHSTASSGGSGTFVIEKYASAPAPGYIRGTFSGTLKSTTGATVNVTNGFLQVPLQ